MGFGSVIAMGCSIGQGVSAFSTLAISGPTTLAAIIIGSIIAIRQILTGYQP
jgi:flagellar biosynthesis protein FliQ